ncbi:MAG TPA: STAS/SEC14 domain-containing protein [Candidatus Saccharimonadales bacterium]|nr:STAS/SEC14 domain-containing protein [Candidatus Saccharimonadales bacterium]
MQNKVYLDDQGIIVIEVIGDQTEESVEHMGQEANQLITEQRKLGKRTVILDNILQMGSVGPEARKLVVELGKRLDYDKAALLGKGGIMRLGTTLMLHATRQTSKLKYFDDEQEARTWLLAA